MPILRIDTLCYEAGIFSAVESQHSEPLLYGVTDGKAVGTYLEQKFKLYLQNKYDFIKGNSASGIDFPGLLVDIKVTSVKQPQSSCPFKSARQKIFGLGYSLIIFVYEKVDNSTNRTATLSIFNTIFVSAERTADFQITSPLAIDFYSSLIFWDEKRPIKTSILNSLDLSILSKELSTYS